MITISPKISEVEITLIGTGGGYGESILIKIDIDTWIIVDSCINPSTKLPLALEYLSSINVPLAKIKMIVCTHWHNDHIKGLAKVLSECENAEFCFSSVHDLNKFLFLCELDHQKTNKGSVSSTNEFADCLKIMNSRNSYVTRAQSNLLLYKTQNKTANIEFLLYSLSPSPKTIADFDSEISQLITDFGSRNTAIINKSPNDKSVALLLKFGEHRVILGADLEIGKNDNEGWQHIIKHSKVIDENKANLYKLPHHGSENGYMSEIFDVLVNNNCVLKSTPYKTSGLPTADMIKTYLGHSEELYLTSDISTLSKKAKKRDMAIEKVIQRSVISLKEVKFVQGVVRSRIDYIDNLAIWKTETFDGAFKVKS